MKTEIEGEQKTYIIGSEDNMDILEEIKTQILDDINEVLWEKEKFTIIIKINN